MKLSIAILGSGGAIAAILLLAAPAGAKVGDAEWAQCVVRSDPQGTQAWLKMAMPTWATDFDAANLLLGHRLAALCDATAVIASKPKRPPNWNALASSLRKAASKAPISAGAAPVTIKLCTSAMPDNGKDMPFLRQIVRTEADTDVVVFEQYYGNVQGRSVKLPTDLRVVPKGNSAVKRECRAIGSNGELSNA